MKTPRKSSPHRLHLHWLGLLMMLWGAPGLIQAQSVKMMIPPGNYAKQIGEGSLADPTGKSHTRQDVKNKVVVAIFSVPNMSQGDLQEKWASLLADQPSTKVSDKVALYLVEDMSQAGMFKGMARESMKKDFTPGSRPIVILDETGEVVKKFGVAKNTTIILIYDKRSRLRDVENKLDDEDLTIRRIKVITRQLLAE